MLTGAHLTKIAKNGVAILDDVSVEVPSGKVVAVIGPSGAGKTTLVRTLSLLDPPDSGVVVVDGSAEYRYPLARTTKPPASPWPDVTVVFQSLFLFPHLTLRENILLPARREARNTRTASMAPLVESLDLVQVLDRYPSEASLGQQQRAALVRALALRPRYLLLDEVTSALDVEQVGAVTRVLFDAARSGVGILVVTHLLGFARRVAERFLFMDHGRILEAGSAEMLQRPNHPRVAEFLAQATGIGP